MSTSKVIADIIQRCRRYFEGSSRPTGWYADGQDEGLARAGRSLAELSDEQRAAAYTELANKAQVAAAARELVEADKSLSREEAVQRVLKDPVKLRAIGCDEAFAVSYRS